MFYASCLNNENCEQQMIWEVSKSHVPEHVHMYKCRYVYKLHVIIMFSIDLFWVKSVQKCFVLMRNLVSKPDFK